MDALLLLSTIYSILGRAFQKFDTFNYLQSTLVISTSLILNNRLSRSENLVPVLSQNSTNRQQIMWKRGEIAP